MIQQILIDDPSKNKEEVEEFLSKNYLPASDIKMLKNKLANPN